MELKESFALIHNLENHNIKTLVLLMVVFKGEKSNLIKKPKFAYHTPALNNIEFNEYCS